MLAGMDKAKGGQPEKNRCNDVTGSFEPPTLTEIGITKRQSSDWRASEMLAGMDKAKPPGSNQYKKVDRCDDVTDPPAPTLTEIGITKRQSSDWQERGQNR